MLGSYLDEVQAAIVGDKSCDFFAVLNELDPDTFPDGRVGLLGLYPPAKETSQQRNQGGGPGGALINTQFTFLPSVQCELYQYLNTWELSGSTVLILN